MNKSTKTLLGALALIYIVSPVDLAPGPIDDTIVLLLDVVIQKFISDNKQK